MPIKLRNTFGLLNASDIKVSAGIGAYKNLSEVRVRTEAGFKTVWKKQNLILLGKTIGVGDAPVYLSGQAASPSTYDGNESSGVVVQGQWTYSYFEFGDNYSMYPAIRKIELIADLSTVGTMWCYSRSSVSYIDDEFFPDDYYVIPGSPNRHIWTINTNRPISYIEISGVVGTIYEWNFYRDPVLIYAPLPPPEWD